MWRWYFIYCKWQRWWSEVYGCWVGFVIVSFCMIFLMIFWQFFQSYYLAGMFLIHIEKYDRAQEYIDRAVKMSPQNKDVMTCYLLNLINTHMHARAHTQIYIQMSIWVWLFNYFYLFHKFLHVIKWQSFAIKVFAAF